jgi:parvulin-like peptidyl-prolyl isomerase
MEIFDPTPEEWLTPERLRLLDEQLGPARSSLAIAGLLPKAVERWLRQQLAADAPWSADERLAAIETRREAWLASHNPLAQGLLDEEVTTKLAVAPGCLCWAEALWGHRVETLFLERKEQLDRASCRLLRVADKGLALELYHRIKAGEESFAALAFRYGEGPEQQQGGLIPLQPLAAMPMGLGGVLTKLEPGELLPPTRLGEQVALVQLETFQPASLDASSRQLLLGSELNRWLASAGGLVLAHLMCPQRIEAITP